MKRAWYIAIAVSVAVGCGEQVSGLLQGHEPSEVVEVSGDVAGRVNGSAIGVVEVEQLATNGELAPSAALRRLVAERLLAQEARSRGYAVSARTGEATRKAQVQALLEQAVENVAPSDDELEAAYKAQRARFEKPEQRQATHLLALLPARASADAERAARAFISQTLVALRAAPDADVAAVLESAKSHQSSLFQVKLERLPAAPREGKFVPEFAEALFSLTEPGIVAEPVRTEFGYHAIWVTDIIPAFTELRSVAFETLRAELTKHKQKQRLDALLDELRARTAVRFAPDAQKSLASLDF
jgi:parvulin-like peptidyl-prolyl isomerase